MSKNLNISLLLDFYAPILTDKQKDMIENYYNADLSLAEIAENENISRQGVRDSIKRGEETLLELEQKLKFAEKLTELSRKLDAVKKNAEIIFEESSKFNYSNVITKNASEILDIIGKSDELL